MLCTPCSNTSEYLIGVISFCYLAKKYIPDEDMQGKKEGERNVLKWPRLYGRASAWCHVGSGGERGQNRHCLLEGEKPMGTLLQWTCVVSFSQI